MQFLNRHKDLQIVVSDVASDKTLFIALNEFNFALIKQVAEENDLVHIKRMLSFRHVCADGNLPVDSNELQPWVQWLSLLTGTNFETHGVANLGEKPRSPLSFVWDDLAATGLKSLVVSPLNGFTLNEELVDLVQDPWSPNWNSPPEGYAAALEFSRLMCQSRGAHSHFTAIKLGAHFLRQILGKVGPVQFLKLTSSFLNQSSVDPGQPYVGFAYYEYLLAHSALRDFVAKDYGFCFLLLNSVAHVQHYYWDQSEGFRPTPLEYILQLLDRWLKEVLNSSEQSGIRLIVCNGLTQSVEPDEAWFSYRVKDFDHFFKLLGFSSLKFEPLMSYDFYVELDSAQASDAFEKALANVKVNEKCVFYSERTDQPTKLFLRTAFTDRADQNTTLAIEDQGYTFFDHFDLLAQRKGKHSPRIDILCKEREIPEGLTIEGIKPWLMSSVLQNQ